MDFKVALREVAPKVAIPFYWPAKVNTSEASHSKAALVCLLALELRSLPFGSIRFDFVVLSCLELCDVVLCWHSSHSNGMFT